MSLLLALAIIAAWFAASIALAALWALTAIRTEQAREKIAADASEASGSVHPHTKGV